MNTDIHLDRIATALERIAEALERRENRAETRAPEEVPTTEGPWDALRALLPEAILVNQGLGGVPRTDAWWDKQARLRHGPEGDVSKANGSGLLASGLLASSLMAGKRYAFALPGAPMVENAEGWICIRDYVGPNYKP